jgi:hypothetical protein
MTNRNGRSTVTVRITWAEVAGRIDPAAVHRVVTLRATREPLRASVGHVHDARSSFGTSGVAL